MTVTLFLIVFCHQIDCYFVVDDEKENKIENDDDDIVDENELNDFDYDDKHELED